MMELNVNCYIIIGVWCYYLWMMLFFGRVNTKRKSLDRFPLVLRGLFILLFPLITTIILLLHLLSQFLQGMGAIGILIEETLT